MSEANFTGPTGFSAAETPRYFPTDIRENETTEALDIDAQAATIEAMWQFYQPIPDSAVDAVSLQDENVRDSYKSAELELDDIRNFAKTFHDRIVESAHQFIADKDSEFSEWYKQQEATKSLIIAAIEEEFDRRVQRVNTDKMISVANSKDIIDKAGAMLESNFRTITNLRRIVEGGIKAQTQHESRYKSAINTINSLVVEYEQLQAGLERAQEGLERYQRDLSKNEARQDELMDEENELKAEERLERERIAAPNIMSVAIQLGIDDESHEGYREYIRNARNEATSPELSEILSKIAVVNEKQKHNNRNIVNNTGLVEGTELSIVRNNERLNEIAHLIEEERRKLANELDNISPELEVHSSKYEKIVQQLYAINRENTITAAKDVTIPAILSPVLASVKSVQIALMRANDDTQAKNWPDPKFDTSALPLLPLDPSDEPSDISAASERIENTNKLSHDLEQISGLNIVGMIGRGFRKAGARISYRTDPTVQEN